MLPQKSTYRTKLCRKYPWQNAAEKTTKRICRQKWAYRNAAQQSTVQKLCQKCP